MHPEEPLRELPNAEACRREDHESERQRRQDRRDVAPVQRRLEVRKIVVIPQLRRDRRPAVLTSLGRPVDDTPAARAVLIPPRRILHPRARILLTMEVKGLLVAVPPPLR